MFWWSAYLQLAVIGFGVNGPVGRWGDWEQCKWVKVETKRHISLQGPLTLRTSSYRAPHTDGISLQGTSHWGHLHTGHLILRVSPTGHLTLRAVPYRAPHTEGISLQGTSHWGHLPTGNLTPRASPYRAPYTEGISLQGPLHWGHLPTGSLTYTIRAPCSVYFSSG